MPARYHVRASGLAGAEAQNQAQVEAQIFDLATDSATIMLQYAAGNPGTTAQLLQAEYPYFDLSTPDLAGMGSGSYIRTITLGGGKLATGIGLLNIYGATRGAIHDFVSSKLK